MNKISNVLTAKVMFAVRKGKDMKNRRQLICLLSVLMLLLLCGLVVACSPTSPDSEDPGDGASDDGEEQVAPENSLILVAGGASNYQIIRSDMYGAAAIDREIGIALRKHILTLTEVEALLASDYDDEWGTPRQDAEILIGKTNRDESATALQMLNDSEYDYMITVIGQKICVVAKNERGMRCALEDLTNNYLKQSADGTLYVAKEMHVMGDNYLPANTYFEVKSAQGAGAGKYDEAMALACLQGIMNRESPARVYVNSGGGNEQWLQTMQQEGRWLADVKFEKLEGFVALMEVGGADYVKTVILWDEAVPATVNVATTIAGVEDGLVLSPEAYEKYKGLLNEGVKVINLVGMFDGSVTGSAKNDAYRWAIENYLYKDLCSTDFLAHYMDAWSEGDTTRRQGGDDAYVVVRDWAVYNRAFVMDLSPWNDEAPFDDLSQPVGTDYETFVMVLEYMMEKTKNTAPFEMCGFFDFAKYSKWNSNTVSKHETVPAEWEYVWLISHYNGYHNTCIEWSWNESFHAQYTGAQQLTNNRPEEYLELEENTTYLCFFMADYDSTYPLYRFMQDYWTDPNRGKLPLAWGINPNLLDTYPDIIEYYYETATENDYFTSDASCAGYINPSRVRDELWDLMIEHNIKYFKRADMSIAPMVLDQDRLDEQSLEAFAQFAPDGVSTIIIDQHGQGGSQAPADIYDGIMPTDILYNNFPTDSPANAANAVAACVNAGYARTLGDIDSSSSLSLIRCVWVTPTFIVETVEAYKAAHPDENVVVVDIYNYFNLLKQDLES